MGLPKDLDERIKYLDEVKEIKKKAAYYPQFDYKGSWYSRNPHDACVKVHYKTLLQMIEDVEAFNNGGKNND